MMSPQKFRATQKKIFALIAYLIAPLSGFGIDIYAPSLPNLAHYFHTPSVHAKFTMTAYLIGLGLCQPLVGPLSDSLGRRWLIILGCFATAFTMFLTTLSPNITVVITLRFLQGLCVSICIVPGRAILNDIFEGIHHQKAVSTMTIIWALGPIVAPYLGGHIQNLWGWKANFYALSFYAGIMTLMTLLLFKETIPATQTFQMKTARTHYVSLMKHPHFWYGSLILSLVYAQVVTYATLGAFLIQDRLHYNAVVFGKTGLLIGLGWFIGNIGNRLLINIDASKRILVAIYTGVIIAALFVSISLYFPLNLWTLVTPVFLLTILGGFIFPHLFSHILRLYHHMAATCGAMTVGVIMFTTGVVTALGSSFVSTTALPMALLFTAFWIVVWWCHRHMRGV